MPPGFRAAASGVSDWLSVEQAVATGLVRLASVPVAVWPILPGVRDNLAVTAPPAVLIAGDTIRSPELRNEIPVAVSDALLFVEAGGQRSVVVSPLDAPAVRAACPDVTVLDMFLDLGMRELLDAAPNGEQALLELWLRACRQHAVSDAVVPPAFPLAVADRLRRSGISVVVDGTLFAQRRRSKNARQVAGIERAVLAAEAGLNVVGSALRTARDLDGMLHRGGRLLTCEWLQRDVRIAVSNCDALIGELVVAHGTQTAFGHGPGSGPIATGEPVVVDLWPQDRSSGCFADVARTFVVGQPSEKIVRWHDAAVEARKRVLAAIAPGVTGTALWEHACDAIEAAGIPTPRTSRYEGGALVGFQTTLGHGVGLELHEQPTIGAGAGPLVVGDVIAVEPFICDPEIGAIHIEDMVVVQPNGARCLTRVSVALQP